MPRLSQESLGREILNKCAVRGPLLKKEGCALRLAARHVALVLDMDKNPVKCAMENEGSQRCDFAAYQRPNPVNSQACLILMEFKPKLHNVNEVLDQLGASLEFLERLSGLPKFTFARHASVLVCKEEIGPRKIRRLMEANRPLRRDVTVSLRPLVLVSGGKLTDKQIAESGQPWPQAARKRKKG